MDTTNIQRYLDSFAKNVVTQAQLKLNKDKGNTALGQSIRSEVVRRNSTKSLPVHEQTTSNNNARGVDQEKRIEGKEVINKT